MQFTPKIITYSLFAALLNTNVSATETAFDLINKVVAANNQFAFDCYAKLTPNTNIFFSPYSISTAVAMTYVGARGNTKTQISNTLHFPKNQEQLDTAFHLLINQINQASKHKNISIHTANSIWAQKDYPLSKEFIEALNKYYQTQVKKVDFKTAYKRVRKQINAWVATQTNQKIKKLLNKRVLNTLTRLVLINAIYFKANWANPFDPINTKNAPFWIGKRDNVKVAMMNKKQFSAYMETKELQILELPYEGSGKYKHKNRLSMTILLPRKRNGLAKLEKMLTASKLDKLFKQLDWQHVQVSLPKFKINSKFNLSQTLQKLGMTDAFTSNADFSGIDGSKNLSLDSVIHQAFVEVNEKGTEAAAATAIFMTRGLAVKTPEFRADHPFIFLIRHNDSGNILFMGRVVNPIQ
ncbi:serpin family protein [Candidatus Marithrix sp. Canyon 246]|uniref:serpin family protein n=1 Tax=Candidatus Marithrix sp. Canyon 246 TaxID=1827136 RepID=UPI00084A00A2|nr:serpin family protein [Candidatus Marithrix sp. Canyon 246]